MNKHFLPHCVSKLHSCANMGALNKKSFIEALGLIVCFENTWTILSGTLQENCSRDLHATARLQWFRLELSKL